MTTASSPSLTARPASRPVSVPPPPSRAPVPRSGGLEAEAVADVVATLGFRPEGSLGLRIRRRRRPFAVLRVDLPPTDGESSIAGFSAQLTGLVSRLTGASGVDLIAFEPVAPPGDLLVGLAARLSAAGFAVGLLLQVSDGSVCRVGATGMLAEPRPLAPETSAFPAHRPAHPSSPTHDLADHGDVHHGPFRPLHPISEERRTAALAVLGLASAGGGREGARGELSDHDPLRAIADWAATLDADGLPGDTRALALAWPLRRSELRDLVLLLCAWGTRSAMDAAEESAHPESEELRSVLARFLGSGSEAPSEGRLRRAVEVLRRVAECSPASLAPAPLVMLAWLEWSRGRGTVASAYLDECLRAEPDYTLGRLVRDVIDQGWVPEWLD
ncbi:DUF4192 family protein [Herbiconiux liangxiaofengii]|uniref:DUF4192 family protein n=1 Tax=Herbiconiux liangxiaofengii TaxID=3342795 RepID=UPI0035B7C709